jgi:hypothetical protein
VDRRRFGVHDVWDILPAPTSAAWMALHCGSGYSGGACCRVAIIDEEMVYA